MTNMYFYSSFILAKSVSFGYLNTYCTGFCMPCFKCHFAMWDIHVCFKEPFFHVLVLWHVKINHVILGSIGCKRSVYTVYLWIILCGWLYYFFYCILTLFYSDVPCVHVLCRLISFEYIIPGYVCQHLIEYTALKLRWLCMSPSPDFPILQYVCVCLYLCIFTQRPVQ